MIDDIDARLLAAVQKNALLTAQELGDGLNLSASQAARRRQRLETEGYITSYTARLNPAKLGLNVQAFVHVQMALHSAEGVHAFTSLIASRPEVICAWTLTGEADYFLRVWCADLSALNLLVHHVLLPHPAVARVQSQIVLDQIKPETALPT